MRRLIAVLALAACSSETMPPPMGMPPPREPPPHTVGGFSIQVPPMMMEAGQEEQPCWIFPIEITGPSRIVGGAKLVAPPGMHHGNLTSRPATPGEGIRPCEPGDDNEGLDVLSGGTVLFGSSTQLAGEEWYSFPEGMGYRVKEGHELVARMHYLNASDEPMMVAPTYEWFTIDESKVTRQLAPFFWQYGDFEMAPGETLTVTGECTFAVDHAMHVVTALPHMHKLGTALYAQGVGGPLDGYKFIDSPGYDPDDGVLMQFDPAVDLTDVDAVRFSCTWHNTLDVTIGEGVGDNEMCMIFGYAWPLDQSFNLFANDGGCLVVPTPAD
jgi:hypothetical protein